MGRALILAGGRITGIAWESGVLAGLEAGGFDTQTWDLVVGTSAGAYVGARLTGDGSPGPLFTVQTSGNDAWEESELTVLFGTGYVRAMRLARRPLLGWVGLVWLGNFIVGLLMRYAIRHGWRATARLAMALGPGRRHKAGPRDVLTTIGALANLSRKSPTVLIGNWEHALGVGRPWPATRLIATAIDTTDGTRKLFEASSGVPLVDAISASTCLPGLLAPVRLLGRRYIDGGIVSPTNADVATGHEEVWIISPSTEASTEEGLHREVTDLRSGGARVQVISPSPASRQALPSGFGSLDPVRRMAAARAGYEDGRAAAAAAAADLAIPGRNAR